MLAPLTVRKALRRNQVLRAVAVGPLAGARHSFFYLSVQAPNAPQRVFDQVALNAKLRWVARVREVGGGKYRGLAAVRAGAQELRHFTLAHAPRRTHARFYALAAQHAGQQHYARFAARQAQAARHHFFYL